MPGYDVQIQFQAVAGRSYSLQYRSALDMPWTTLMSLPVKSVDQTVAVPDPEASGVPQRFYRLVTPALP